MSKDALGDRMKAYEAVTRFMLPRRTYTIIRLDGVAFHTFCRGLRRPYDNRLMTTMQETMRSLCENISGVRLGYQQSDEITLVLTDFERIQTQPWYGGGLQKLVSVSAAIATRDFNRVGGELGLPPTALFDSRVFTIPDPIEVANALVWRQKDAIRNSISMAAQAQFSHAELQRKSTVDMIAMLDENGTPWNEEIEEFKNGVWCVRRPETIKVNFPDGTEPTEVERMAWTVEAAPRFTANYASELMARIPLYDTSPDEVIQRAR